MKTNWRRRTAISTVRRKRTKISFVAKIEARTFNSPLRTGAARIIWQRSRPKHRESHEYCTARSAQPHPRHVPRSLGRPSVAPGRDTGHVLAGHAHEPG